ncbi:phage minor head protein [Streptomyces sp. NPDC055103]
MADRDRQLAQTEDDFAEAVAAALTETANEFADAVQAATELVAARFSVGRIARMWGNRTRRLVRRLLGTADTAVQAALEDIGAELPAGWDDLPGRYDDGTLPDSMGEYVETTEHLLRAVGDRLAEAARRELAAGLDAGEDLDQLRARLRQAFAREGAQLGPVREQRIARTEASRAWNTATLAAAQAAEGLDAPIVKQWVTRHDTRVRESHDQVDGQIRLLVEPFTVGGVPMQTPGDPSAPASQVVNCRCRLAVEPQLASSAFGSKTRPRTDALETEETRMDGPLTAAAGGHTGAMIALVPTPEDAERLALVATGSEPAHELHLTLFYLGEGAGWDEEQRADLISRVRARVADIGEPVAARAFGANQWNADGDDPCWVWSVGDDRDRAHDAPTLETARYAAVYALEDMHRQPDLPTQHSPWQPHVAAAYTRSPSLLTAMNQRLGPIRFDRLRIAFAGEHTDIPLGPEQETTMDEAEELSTNTGLAARAWSTPGDTALAFEDEETGDGRVFRPGSLYWSGAGPWPLQYADEMLMGHQGAELAGSIQALGREGGRITGSGVIYPGRPAGADALMLLEEGAPLGVSVDLDDVSVEFVDRITRDEDEGQVVLLASLPSASLLRLDDGSWSLTATAATEWTASGAALSRTANSVQLVTGKDGRISAAAVHAALGDTGTLTAAAGDHDDQDLGTVVHRESSGDLLMRVTRARLRGATLVAMPAYDQARIVLDDQPAPSTVPDDDEQWAASGPSPAHMRVVNYVKSAPVAVGAREVARALDMKMETVRGHLARAAKAGRIVRLAPGLYVGPATEGPDATASADLDMDGDEELVASAWTAMKDLPPMPAGWFKEPTQEELPPGSGGVHYANGRIYGWVAQAGEPHAGYPGKKLTIESLGALNLTHFLRARFRLDDGRLVKAGAFTMNVGHHRDGAECETAACQFDDTRTVAGIVTVGMNDRGLWFSGAAGPWLSEWDRAVFQATQPSYHMKAGPDGRWQLRAVLSVPEPGHSSPLLAAAVAERSNLALAASAAGAVLDHADASGQAADVVPDNPSNPADTTAHTRPDLPGQRPDTVPDNPADTSGPSASSSTQLDAVVSALAANGPLLDVLAAALQQRDTEHLKEESAELAAASEPEDAWAQDEVEALLRRVHAAPPVTATF